MMTCPICNKPTNDAVKPFCSKRCADIDLHQWFTGAYALPSEDEPDEGELEQLVQLMENEPAS